MRICVDFTKLIPKKGNAYHGGGYYAYQVIGAILEYSNRNFEVSILWPRDFTPIIEADFNLLNKSKNNLYTENMWKEDYSKYDILYIPMISPRNFSRLKKIKKENKNLKIAVGLFDLRLADMLRLDYYSKYYFKGQMPQYLLRQASRYAKWVMSRIGLQYAGYADLVITSSNYSMQQIIKYSKTKNITYYYDSVEVGNFKSCLNETEPFILFVSANREEKNFARSVEAYLSAVCTGGVSMPLYVTGNIDVIKQLVSRNKKINLSLFKQHVKLLGYVEEDEMQKLYATCSFLLYTSKSEGFGLPALQAGIYGRPVVAANTTAVPEVLGSVAYYINPYDVNSIKQGIVNMSNQSIRSFYENRAKAYVTVLDMQMKNGLKRTVEDILNIYNNA